MKIKKRKAMLLGLAATTLFSAAGFSSCNNNEADRLYGPPSDIDVETNEPEAVYGPPIEFETESEGFETESESGAETASSLSGESKTVVVPVSPSKKGAESNIMPVVYGPPEDFTVEDNELEDVYGPPVGEEDPEEPEILTPADAISPDHISPGGTPPSAISPNDNMMHTLYGPPPKK